MTTTVDRTAELAWFLSGLGRNALPERITERVKDLVLDYFGVALCGLALPWSTIIADDAEADGGRGEATLYGRGRVSARSAALANATIGHGIELDDIRLVPCGSSFRFHRAGVPMSWGARSRSS